MRQKHLSSWFVFSMLLASFTICGFKIHIGTRGTILGYELATLKAKESTLFHHRNRSQARLSRVQNAEYLQKVVSRNSDSTPDSLVMNQ